MRLSTYPFEKFMDAVDVLATSDRPLRDRIASAFKSLSAVKASDFKDAETRGLYEGLIESMRKVKDPDRGSIVATLEQMTDEEVGATADKIVQILHRLIREGD